MNKVRLWSYKLGSQGARNLQSSLTDAGVDCLRVRTDGRYRPRDTHLIINWGNSAGYAIPPWVTMSVLQGQVKMLNKPGAVEVASNKLETFNILFRERINIPKYTTSPMSASYWFREGITKVYCRTKLTGHSGEGIHLAHCEGELVIAPLYTGGINTKGEYRVHVFKKPQGEYNVIDVQKKRRRNEAVESGNINMDIRNLLGGWVYAHNNVELEDTALEQAKRAVEVLGLDFGAVDIVLEKNTNKPYVLEVNTAPGLQDSRTLAAYAEAIKEYIC